MPEILLHYIWLKGIFLAYPQTLTDGRQVEVLSVGAHNLDSGPDFTNVRLRIEGVEFIGNIEIHVNGSDWYKHRHHLDKTYDNILIHVVKKADKKIYNSLGEAIPQLELQYPDDEDYITQLIQYARQMDSAFGSHQCAEQLTRDPKLLTLGWRQAMGHRRLECKNHSIQRLLSITCNNWDEAFYITLAHHFGFHTNGVPFEMLAMQTPLKVLLKHRNSLPQLTAMLLGQSGLMTEDDPLYKEYLFLKQKFSLSPIAASVWKTGRIRPQNHPAVRIRQFAELIYRNEFLFSRLMDAEDIPAIRSILQIGSMGRETIDSLIINVVIPYKYARMDTRMGAHEAERLLTALPAENNRIIRQWKALGQQVQNAADSQALIHLYMTCCQSAGCMNCDVAYQIFVNNKL